MTGAALGHQRGWAPAGATSPDPMERRHAAGRQALILVAAGLVVLGLMSGLGLVLTHVLDHSAIIRADHTISDGLFHHRTPFWNSVTWWTTQFGEALTVIVLAAVVAIALGVRTRRFLPSAFIAAALIGESSIYVLITLLVHRQRPLVKHLDAAPPTSSFPSGHTAASLCLYGALAFLAWRLSRRRPLQIALTMAAVVLPIAVAIARVYRGMHFPTDVMSGAVLGALWLTVVTRVLGPGLRLPDQQSETDPSRQRVAA